MSFPGGSEVKASASNAGDPASIPGSGRSPGKGNGHPLQYSCLENSRDRGAWWAAWGCKELDTTEETSHALTSARLLIRSSSHFLLTSPKGKSHRDPRGLARQRGRQTWRNRPSEQGCEESGLRPPASRLPQKRTAFPGTREASWLRNAELVSPPHSSNSQMRK